MLDIFLEPAIRRISASRAHTHGNRRKTQDEEAQCTAKTADSRVDTGLTAVVDAPSTRFLKRTEWNMSSTRQLQRLAHEAIGAGTWHGTTSEIPVTSPDQTL